MPSLRLIGIEGWRKQPHTPQFRLLSIFINVYENWSILQTVFFRLLYFERFWNRLINCHWLFPSFPFCPQLGFFFFICDLSVLCRSPSFFKDKRLGFHFKIMFLKFIEYSHFCTWCHYIFSRLLTHRHGNLGINLKYERKRSWTVERRYMHVCQADSAISRNKARYRHIFILSFFIWSW